METDVLSFRKVNVFSHPSLITSQFRAGSQTPVGHHGKNGSLQRSGSVLGLDNLADSQVLPDFPYDIEGAVLPGIFKLPSFLHAHPIFRRLSPDASDKLPEAVNGPVIGTAQGADDMHPGPSFIFIPDIFGDLEVGDGSPVGVVAGDFAEIHDIYLLSQYYQFCQVLIYIPVYLCILCFRTGFKRGSYEISIT
jgi:hypothetical protein